MGIAAARRLPQPAIDLSHIEALVQPRCGADPWSIRLPESVRAVLAGVVYDDGEITDPMLVAFYDGTRLRYRNASLTGLAISGEFSTLSRIAISRALTGCADLTASLRIISRRERDVDVALAVRLDDLADGTVDLARCVHYYQEWFARAPELGAAGHTPQRQLRALAA